ncbi:3-methyladenine DNA glycosylase 2 [Aquabacterium sp.]|uniref:DNA-3-methyladenine glycosylase family protein n=1 Tax=Aquabacterium sp. TaxID=1872578 RepID=UPI00248A6808|nr:3-methyladenine DNA glycosylase 2 [Aquabacterium sp.]MDI1259008.1 3-methyladenine DNA glycosylase 2 [Aquabacterium sp.]
MMPLECVIPLPANYRQADVLAFHGRDAQSSAESVQGAHLSKGIVLRGFPVVVELKLSPAEAWCSLSVDGPVGSASVLELEDLARRLLGLRMDVDAFEALHVAHPELGALVLAQSGLRVPMAATPFEALIWAVTGQQINVGVASQLRRRLILLGGRQHSSGLWCHPDAQGVAQLHADQLREARFSVAKTQTILTISRLASEGRLPLDDWMAVPLAVPAMEAALLAIKGVGPWTVNYTLLRGFGHADGSLHGDVAVRNALQRLLGQADKVSAAQTEAWLKQFAPWRSLVAAHLWGSLRFSEG